MGNSQSFRFLTFNGYVSQNLRTATAVKGCRSVSKKDLVHNDATPNITVDAERYEVRVDGELITCEPVDTVPLGQRYFLF